MSCVGLLIYLPQLIVYELVIRADVGDVFMAPYQP